MKPYESPVPCKYGAPMGRRSDNPANFNGRKTHLRQVRFYDYAYDKGGAYWGSGTPLFCAWSEAGSDDQNDEYIVYYFRESSRDAARKHMLEYGARLYR